MAANFDLDPSIRAHKINPLRVKCIDQDSGCKPGKENRQPGRLGGGIDQCDYNVIRGDAGEGELFVRHVERKVLSITQCGSSFSKGGQITKDG